MPATLCRLRIHVCQLSGRLSGGEERCSASDVRRNEQQPTAARSVYSFNDGTEFSADTSPEGARNIGLLEDGVERGADSVHPYVAPSLSGDEFIGVVAEAFGGRVQWVDLRDDLAATFKHRFGFFNGANLRGTNYLRSP